MKVNCSIDGKFVLLNLHGRIETAVESESVRHIRIFAWIEIFHLKYLIYDYVLILLSPTSYFDFVGQHCHYSVG